MRTSLKNSALSILVLASSIIAITPSHAATPSYYNNCGVAAQVKPNSITEYCADAGAGVISIKWSLWTRVSARGQGTFYVNDCTPTCVAGKVYRTRANVELSEATLTHGKNYLMKVTVTPAAAKYFFWSKKQKPIPSKITWVTDTWRG